MARHDVRVALNAGGMRIDEETPPILLDDMALPGVSSVKIESHAGWPTQVSITMSAHRVWLDLRGAEIDLEAPLPKLLTQLGWTPPEAGGLMQVAMGADGDPVVVQCDCPDTDDAH